MFEEPNLLSSFLNFDDADEEESFSLTVLKNDWMNRHRHSLKELRESLLHVEDWTEIKSKCHKKV